MCKPLTRGTGIMNLIKFDQTIEFGKRILGADDLDRCDARVFDAHASQDSASLGEGLFLHFFFFFFITLKPRLQ